MLHEKHLSEPWFSLILVGKKKVEGRLNTGSFKNMKVGDIIQFFNEDFGYKRTFKVAITKKTLYKSFKDYLVKEKLDVCLPGIETVDRGVAIYHKYYKPADEAQFGVIAIKLDRVSKIR